MNKKILDFNRERQINIEAKLKVIEEVFVANVATNLQLIDELKLLRQNLLEIAKMIIAHKNEK
jgi:hypothetical protein